MRTIKVFLPIVFGILFTIALIVGFTHASEVTAATNNGDIIYVDADAPGPTHNGTSWTNAYTTVQSALAASTNGDEIWVAQGVYYPDEGTGQTNNDRDSTFLLKNGVAIYGGFGGYGINETLRTQRNWVAHPTVLSGDIDKNDTNTDSNFIAEDTNDIQDNNTHHVVYSSDVTESAHLDGFVISAGLANGSWPRGAGGGMFNTHSAPMLTNLTFIGNWAEFGGGMYNYDDSTPTLTNIMFSGNVADSSGGGVKNSSSNSRLINVVFSGNSADYGGGMSTGSSSVSLTNVTFSGNSATFSAGGLDATVWTDFYTLTNTIFWGNTAPSASQVAKGTYTNISFINCDVQGSGGSANWDTDLGTDWGENIDADPLFVSDPDAGVDGWGDDNDDYGDLHLQAGSPAIDTGTNWGCPPTDMDGNPRPVNVLCDMGAFEFQNSPPNAVDDGGAYFSTESDAPFWTISVLSNDTDPDDDILQVDSFDTSGTLGVVTHLGYGVFSYDPDGKFVHLEAGEQATDTFTYTATDGNGGTDTAMVTITITGKSRDCQCVFLPQVEKEE